MRGEREDETAHYCAACWKAMRAALPKRAVVKTA